MKKINLIMPILLSLVTTVLAHTGEEEGLHPEGYGMMGGMMTGAYGLGMGIFGWLFGLLVIVILVLLIVWLIKQIQKK